MNEPEHGEAQVSQTKDDTVRSVAYWHLAYFACNERRRRSVLPPKTQSEARCIAVCLRSTQVKRVSEDVSTFKSIRESDDRQRRRTRRLIMQMNRAVEFMSDDFTYSIRFCTAGDSLEFSDSAACR